MVLGTYEQGNVVTFSEKAYLGSFASFNGAVHIEPVVVKKFLAIILNIKRSYILYFLGGS